MKKTLSLLTALVLLFCVSLSHAQNTQTFSFQGNVFQTYTVPITGWYLLDASGAEGAWWCNGWDGCKPGGLGARLQNYTRLVAGDVLTISVGEKGGTDGMFFSCCTPTACYYSQDGAGGGGASHIMKMVNGSYQPLMVAAGGGGGSSQSEGSPGLAPNCAGGTGGGIGSDYNGGAGGGGYLYDGAFHYDRNNVLLSAGGQSFQNGNYGGIGRVVTDYDWYGEYSYWTYGGWGGGGSGGPMSGCLNSGGGGGGGGWNGGNGGTDKYSGGQGGCSFVPFVNYGYRDSSGVNSGNGSVSITGPNIVTDTVNATSVPYIWPVNGGSYSNAGTYVWEDPAHAVTHILDLSFVTLGACQNYTRVDTTIVSCGGYTFPLTGRTYTENTTDSIRIGCIKYVGQIIVTPPSTALAIPMATGAYCLAGELIGSSNPHDHASKDFAACRNTVDTFTVAEVPYATSYSWSLPNGASGSSTTNRIVVSFGNQFRGGTISVTPVNACGNGDTLSKNIILISRPPAGRLQITGPGAPFISGNYSVTPISGATSYTWSVSNNQAVIVSGQGTPTIQLEAQPGFTRANLSVVASNCRGNGSQGTLVLSTRGNGPGAAYAPPRMAEDEMEDFSVYPNPTSGQFMLNTPSLPIDATLEVYSIEGRLVHTQSIPANTTQTSIDLHQPAAGLYQVRVVAGEEVKSVKVVVQ